MSFNKKIQHSAEEENQRLRALVADLERQTERSNELIGKQKKRIEELIQNPSEKDLNSIAYRPLALSKEFLNRNSEISLIEPTEIFKGLADLGKSKEIDEMKSRIRVLESRDMEQEQQLKQSKNIIENLQSELITKEREAEGLRKRIRQCDGDLMKLRSSLLEMEDFAKQMNEREKQSLKKQYDREIIQRDRKIKTLEDQSMSIHQENQMLKQEVGLPNKNLTQFQFLYDELGKKYNLLQNELEIVLDKNADLNQQLDAMRYAMRDERNRFDHLNSTIAWLKEANANLEIEIENERNFFREQIKNLEDDLLKFQVLRNADRIETQLSHNKSEEEEDIMAKLILKQNQYIKEKGDWQATSIVSQKKIEELNRELEKKDFLLAALQEENLRLQQIILEYKILLENNQNALLRYKNSLHLTINPQENMFREVEETEEVEENKENENLNKRGVKKNKTVANLEKSGENQPRMSFVNEIADRKRFTRRYSESMLKHQELEEGNNLEEETIETLVEKWENPKGNDKSRASLLFSISINPKLVELCCKHPEATLKILKEGLGSQKFLLYEHAAILIASLVEANFNENPQVLLDLFEQKWKLVSLLRLVGKNESKLKFEKRTAAALRIFWEIDEITDVYDKKIEEGIDECKIVETIIDLLRGSEVTRKKEEAANVIRIFAERGFGLLSIRNPQVLSILIDASEAKRGIERIVATEALSYLFKHECIREALEGNQGNITKLVAHFLEENDQTTLEHCMHGLINLALSVPMRIAISEERILDRIVLLSTHSRYSYCATLSYILLTKLYINGGPQHKMLICDKAHICIYQNLSSKNTDLKKEALQLLKKIVLDIQNIQYELNYLIGLLQNINYCNEFEIRVAALEAMLIIFLRETKLYAQYYSQTNFSEKLISQFLSTYDQDTKWAEEYLMLFENFLQLSENIILTNKLGGQRFLYIMLDYIKEVSSNSSCRALNIISLLSKDATIHGNFNVEILSMMQSCAEKKDNNYDERLRAILESFSNLAQNITNHDLLRKSQLLKFIKNILHDQELGEKQNISCFEIIEILLTLEEGGSFLDEYITEQDEHEIANLLLKLQNPNKKIADLVGNICQIVESKSEGLSKAGSDDMKNKLKAISEALRAYQLSNPVELKK